MQTFKSYCESTGVTSVSKAIRKNTNGYPFITILRGSDAENIYFAKTIASEIGSEVTRELAGKLYVMQTTNASGEERIKLCFANSAYQTLDDLF